MQLVYGTHDKWKESRVNGIGGSDVSAVIGLNPYKSNIDLWEEKTGLKNVVNISDKPYVRYGHEAEPLLVKLFALDYPEYEVNYNDNYRVNYSDEYKFIYCTRDCDLVDKITGKKGALEIKTTEIINQSQWSKWDNQIPQNYYCQVLQYFITDKELEFVILKAQLKRVYSDRNIQLITKHYLFERKDYESEIEFLLKKEIEFWQNVLSKKKPNCILPEI